MNATINKLRKVWVPHSGQEEFLCNSAPIKVLACGRRWGKTDACAALLASAWLERPQSRQLILAPTLDQARLLFDRTIELVSALLGSAIKITERRSPYPYARWGDHRLMARSGHLGRALRGQEATDIVIDEAAFIPESIITEIAMPMLATTKGRLVMLSTPNGLNHFWRFFKMGERGEHGIWSRHAPSMESPYVSQSYLEVQRELISERAFRVEYGAEFVDSIGRVFRTELIQSAVFPRLDVPVGGPVSIGVDWARYTDYTAVAVLSGTREGCALVELDRFQGLPWRAQVERVAEILRRFPGARVLCDATGVGDPVLEMLRAEVPSAACEGLVFTQGLKHELIDNLAWLFEKSALRMTPHPDLQRELEHFEVDGRKFGAPSGFHDDLVVALALAARGLPRSYRPAIQLGEVRKFAKGKPLLLA